MSRILQFRSIFPNYLKFILKYPRTVIAFWITVSLFLGVNIVNLKIDPDVKTMLPQDMDIVRDMDRLEEIFGGSEIVIVSFVSADIFNPATLAKIQRMTADLEQLEFVDRVVSLSNAQEVRSTADGFEVSEVMPEFPQTPADVNALKERLKNNNLLYGNIVSTDFKKAALLVMLKSPIAANDDQKIYHALAEIRRRYQDPEQIYFAGLSITRYAVANTMQGDLKALFPYGLILMIIFLVFSFRSWIGTFLPFVVMILVVVQTLGLMALLGIKFTFVGIIIPVMLIAVTSSYSIHLIAHFFHEYFQHTNSSKTILIHNMQNALQVPVFLSAATTLVGFLSLQSHVLPPVRQLGVMVSFGIVVAFLMSLSFIPAALYLLELPPVLVNTKKDSWLDRWLGRWGEFLIARGKWILIIVVVLIIAIATGIPRVKVDTNPIYFWDENSEIRQSSKLTDENFGGSSQIAILGVGDFQDPQYLRRVDSLCTYLQTWPNVTRVNSIVDELKMMNRAFHGDSLVWDKIPATREEIAQYLFLFSLTGDSRDLDRFVDYDYRQGQIIARVTESGSNQALQMYRATKAHIAQYFGAENFPVVTGMTAFVGVLADLVVRGQIRSLILSLGLVWLMTSLIFRSGKIGFIAITPLGIAMVILFGLMGYLKINLDMATVMLSSIMIGVGVDYGVHFIYRYRREVKQGASFAAAIPLTLRSSGKSILFNGISVIVGFIVLMISGFLPIYFFGFLIVVSITACLFGALTIVPVILMLTRPEFLVNRQI